MTVLKTVFALAVCLACSGFAARGQSPTLHIVVLSGEDAVNIVQKKTAVQPAVEVRDRNDLPVAGASVIFRIGSGAKAASLGKGVQTIALTTDSGGRAALSNLQAVGKGAFRIEVQASYQGETASTTISQTNFATLGDAAQAGRSVPTPNNGGQVNQGAAQASHHVGLIAGGAAAAGGIVVAKSAGLFGDGEPCAAQDDRLSAVGETYILALSAFNQCAASSPAPGACNPAAAAVSSSAAGVRTAIDQLCACTGRPSDSAKTFDEIFRGFATETTCNDR
jgi:hypothetical protein